MAQSGKIQAITGLVTARTQEGTVRELHVGDVVFENEIIATSTGASISIAQEDGNIIALAGDDQILLDESVNGSITPSDAVVQDIAEMQDAILQAFENNTDIDEVLEETSAGELDDTYDFRPDYHEGDTTKGDVGTYLLDPENNLTDHLYKQFFGDDPDNDNNHHTHNPDQATVTITLDPNITGDGIIDAAEAAGNIAITGTVGGNVQDGDVVTLLVNDNIYTGAVSNGIFTIEVPGSELIDDANSEIEARITITDSSGNSVTATDTQGYLVDTTAPTAAVDIADDGNNQDMISSTDDLTATRISGTIEPDGTITGLRVSDGTNTIVIPPETVTVTGDGTWFSTIDVSSLADGTLTVSLDSEDALGNQALTVTDYIEKDTVTSVTIDDIANTNDATPIASGSGEPGSTIVLTDSSGNSVGSATVQDDGSWTAELNSLPDGDNTITATATDPYGNRAEAATPPFIVDTTAPTAAVDIADDGNNQDMISSTDDLTATRLSGTIEPDGTITGLRVSDGTNTIVIPPETVTVTGDGTWFSTVDVSSLADGTLTVSLDSQDALGNQALTVTDSIEKDTVTSVTIDDIANTNDATPIASGSGEPGSTIVLTDSSGNSVGSAIVEDDGSWTTEINNLPDGEYTITATATDPYGNSVGAATPPFIVDTTAPTATVDIADDGNNQDMISSTDDLTATRLSGTIEPDGTITGLTVSDGTNTIVISPDDVTIGDDGTWSTTIDVSSLTDGTLTVSLDSEDALGNQALTVTDSIEKDTVTSVTIDDIANTKDATPVASGSGEPGSTIVLTDSSGNNVGSATVQDDGSWTVELNSLPDGDNTITATATDPYGNRAEAATPPFIVDTTAPTAAVDIADDGNNQDMISSTDDLTATRLSGTIEPDGTITGLRVSDGTNTIVISPDDVTIGDDGTWSTTIDVSSLTDGTLTVSLDSEDALGNQALTVTDSIEKDTVTSVTIDDIANTKDATPVASGSGEPGSTIVLTDSSGNNVGSATVQDDGSWTVELNSLPDGEYTITATATDPYGNRAEAATPPFIVDTTAPTAAVDIADDGNNQDMISSTDDLTATRLSGTIEPDGTITGLRVSDGTNTIVISPDDVTIGDDGTWSTTIDVSSLTDGTLTVSLDSEDALGNQALTVTDSIEKDTVTSVTIDDIANTNDATPVASGSGEPGSTIVLTDSSGNSVGSAIVEDDGSWTTEINNLPDGEYTITATATDPYGNSVGAATPPFIVDTTASTPIITLSDSEGNEDTAIPLNITSALTDTDGSETLSDLTISGVPAGAVLSAGTDNGHGSWTLTQEQLEGLTITPPHDSDADFTLTASATSTETNGETATTTEFIDVTVNAVADAPTVILNIIGQDVVNDGLVGHWVFDEDDTARGRTFNLVDGREGILAGDARFNTEGHINSSMVLDGNGDYVDVAGDYTTPLAGTATLSAWIKLPVGFTGAAGNNDIGWDSPSIIGSEQDGGTNDIQWGWISDDGHINMGVANSYGAKSTTQVNDGDWHHVVLTRDHMTGETKVYVDSVLEDTTVTVTGIKDSTSLSGFGATFGSNGANEYLQGELDDIRVYDRVLTDYEISQISTYENSLHDYDLVGLEGDPIPFALDAGLVDTDGSESITSIMISDIPEGAILTDGSNILTATGSNNEVDVLSWDKNNLSITADANDGGEGQAYTLTVSATSTESSNNDSAAASTPLKIFVLDTAPVALDDHDSVGYGGTASGNIIIGVGGEDMEADQLGHDTAAVSSIRFGDTTYFFHSSGNLTDGVGQPVANNTISADHGTLQINSDGSYTYISNEPLSNVNHLDTFRYTLVDADGDTSTADFSVSHDSLTTVTDSATVYEAGLASGTAAATSSEVIAGNLLDNDLGVGATARITLLSSDGNTDTSAANGILTVDTAHGTITVYTVDTAGHRAGDYVYTLVKTTTGDNVTDTISYTVKNDHGGSSSSTLAISIVDDAPIGSNIVNNIEDRDNSSQTTNLIIVLDKSGSMAFDLEGNRSGSTNFNVESVRMDIAKEALSSMFDSFDNLGNVNIQFVPFSSNASKSQWFIDDKSGANDYLAGITPNGGTYYDIALEETIADYAPPSADKTLVYFISDGEPTGSHGINAGEKSNWESFIESNKIDIAFGIGITDNVNLDSLKPIAYPNTNGDGLSDPYAVQVLNAFDLNQTLLETVSEGIVRGDASILTPSVDGGIVIGADGGHIQSILVDGVLHEYHPVTNQTESITTNRGGTISINYETGEYYYIINPKDTVSGEEETFVITAADNDGDTKSVDLVIHLDYLATLDANHDRIITNTAEGDSLNVTYDTLLANDAGSSHTTIDHVIPGAGTDLTTSADKITLTDLADGDNFTYQISADGVSDSAKVEVVRVAAAQLQGTSGDDILINNKPTARDYSIETIVKPGSTYNQTNQIGIIFAGTADLYITDITIDLRDGIDTDAYFNIQGSNSSGPDIGAATTFITGGQIFSATQDTPTLDLHFGDNTFSPQNAFWFGVDTNRLGDNEGVDFGERGVGITVTLNDGTELSGTYTTQPDGSSSVTLSDASPALYGEEGDDYLQGGNADEIFDGGEGRDTIDAGDGDDSIVFDRADAHIDGGNGLDTLLIADEALDFSALRDGTIENIEKIDLSGSSAQTVSLSLDDVLDMTGVENVLEVSGEAGDTVAIDVTGWTQDADNSGLFSKGGESISIVSSTDSDNAVHIDYTDDGTEVG